jgi:hypothetical protein
VKKLVLVTAAFVAAVVIFAALTIPPRRLALPASADGTIAGVIHVHTNRSDGSSGPDEIAAAAARAGVKFLVFTDHGDATRTPDPPTYRSGVLCLDGVEISTNGGHYIALDMPASPYPLAGEPRDVVEDVRRLGGFGIAAHPDSPKPQLRWLAWTAPFDGIEVFNLDTSWRLTVDQATTSTRPREPGGPNLTWLARRRIVTALLDYPVRPAETIASLLQDGGVSLRWAELAARRRVVAIAGADAHAKLALRNADPGDSRFALPLPGYESSFRVLSVHVRTEGPLTGAAAADAALVMRALRAGHLYMAIDAVATPAAFEFSATNGHGTVREGDEIGAAGPLLLHVRSNAPPEFTTVVHEGTRTLASHRDAQDLTVHASDRAAVYWVEILSTGRAQPVTWLRSNAIYVRSGIAAETPPARPPSISTQPIFDGQSTAGWRVEHDPTSLAAVDPAAIVGGAELRFRYGLAGGSPAGQVAALAFDTPAGTADRTRLTFTIRAERPMRVSVQLRGGDGAGSQDRWQRSVYVDVFDQERHVDFDDVTPVGATHTVAPPFASIRSILFVVDGTNTKPGASGRIWIKKAALER